MNRHARRRTQLGCSPVRVHRIRRYIRWRWTIVSSVGDGNAEKDDNGLAMHWLHRVCRRAAPRAPANLLFRSSSYLAGLVSRFALSRKHIVLTPAPSLALRRASLHGTLPHLTRNRPYAKPHAATSPPRHAMFPDLRILPFIAHVFATLLSAREKSLTTFTFVMHFVTLLTFVFEDQISVLAKTTASLKGKRRSAAFTRVAVGTTNACARRGTSRPQRI